MSSIEIMLVYITIGGFRKRLSRPVGDTPMLTDAGTQVSSGFADIRCIAMQTAVFVHHTREQGGINPVLEREKTTYRKLIIKNYI